VQTQACVFVLSMPSKAAIRPGPVGFQFNFSCVRVLEDGISCPAKRASQPKCASASSGLMLITGTISHQPAGVCFTDCLHRHTLLVDRVIDCARLRFLEGQTIQSRYV